jgi:hypothetical protein
MSHVKMAVGRCDIDMTRDDRFTIDGLGDWQRSRSAQHVREMTDAVGRKVHDDKDRRREVPWQAGQHSLQRWEAAG